jgi:hypothetical protein
MLADGAPRKVSLPRERDAVVAVSKHVVERSAPASSARSEIVDGRVPASAHSVGTRPPRYPLGGAPLTGSNLVDPASSHMLVSKIKPCMSKYIPH